MQGFSAFFLLFVCKDVQGFGAFLYLYGKSYVDKELLKISRFCVSHITERLGYVIETGIHDFILYCIVQLVNFLQKLVLCKYKKGSVTSIGLSKVVWTEIFNSISYLT